MTHPVIATVAVAALGVVVVVTQGATTASQLFDWNDVKTMIGVAVVVYAVGRWLFLPHIQKSVRAILAPELAQLATLQTAVTALTAALAALTKATELASTTATSAATVATSFTEAISALKGRMSQVEEEQDEDKDKPRRRPR